MTRFAGPFAIALALIALGASPVFADDAPALPAGLEAEDPELPGLPEGLGGGEEPGLPEGLGGDEGPALPEGLGEDGATETPAEEPPPSWLDEVKAAGLRGFLDLRAGLRLQDDDREKDASLGEARLQLGFSKSLEGIRIDLVTDLLLDAVADERDVDLERGTGFLDLRQASVALSPLDFMDVKVGRQILTWGTGDLLFINDLFPKDWQAFFIGRDTEYLKAPSDAIKVGVFSEVVNVDLIYTPRFDADRHITGERISYWSGALVRRAGRQDDFDDDRPDDWFTDDEVAIRIHRPVESFEVALYGYHGFWKSPAGMDPMTAEATFPALAVYGASVRGPFAGGIVNAEVGYHDSLDDRGGDDPFVENGQTRLLVGFERDVPEIAHDLTLGVQWYAEIMHEHGDYRRGLPPGATKKDATRHVGTLRVTKRLMAQTLDLSGFLYVSPTDSDGYLRLNADYRIDDHWSAFAGVNWWFGEEDDTFFGQFEKNTNLFVGARWSF